MQTASLFSENLLDPIPGGRPAGEDLRWTPEWDRIKEARRSDDALDAGKWAKKDAKSANWSQVLELTASALSERSKDLQLAVWFTEAAVKVHGWQGLRDGLQLTRELMVRFWDDGLYPLIEDGPEDRAGPLEWLNEKLLDILNAVPITARIGGDNFSRNDLIEARQVGSEAALKDADGEVDAKKKKQFDAALAAGRISLDMFDRAVKDSRRADAEALSSVFDECLSEFTALDRTVDEKFGDAAPSMGVLRAGLQEIQTEFASILEKKRRDEPDAVAAAAPSEGTEPAQPQPAVQSMVIRMPISTAATGTAPAGHRWEDAEQLIRSGQVDAGLAEMTRLAAAETSGRDRFRRKLVLAEVCLTSGRERLARSILEQLSEQIDKYQLEHWESSELVGTVWARLYELYKGRDAEADKAKALYERLCRLDPWQALSCREV